MPHDQPHLQTEQKIPTMIEGLQDYPDFKNKGNQANQENQGQTMIGRITG
jgi:hypothetical protein